MENEHFVSSQSKITAFLNEDFLPAFKGLHDKCVDYVNDYAIFYGDWKRKTSEIDDKVKLFSLTSDLHRKIEHRLTTHGDLLSSGLIFEQYKLLEELIDSIINNYDNQIILNQEPIHFKSSENDSQTIKFKKGIKSFLFSSVKKSYQLVKGKEQEYNWKRRVPLNNLANHYLSHNFLNKVLKEAELYTESVATSLLSILKPQKESDSYFIHSQIPFLENESDSNFEDNYQIFLTNTENIIRELEKAYANFEEVIINAFGEEFKELKQSYNIIGTVQLSDKKFSDKRKIKEQEAQKLKLEKSKNNFNNFISAVFDRKEYYEDLLWFGSLLIGNSYNIKKHCESFYHNRITPSIEKIISEINISIKNIGNSNSELKFALESEKEKLKEKLDQDLIPNLINQVATSKVPDSIISYLKKNEQNLNEFEKEYTFVNPKNLIYRLKKDQLKEFSPKEIISPIVIKKLENYSEKIIEKFNTQTSKLNSTIMDLGRIAEFNLDSAKVKLDEEGSEKDDSISIANEGLLRAINKTENYFEELDKILDEVTKSIEQAIIDILEDFISLSNIDRLITIKLQVSKEKAIEEVKDRFKDYYDKLSKWFVWLKNRSLALFFASKEKIIGISSKVGLGAGQIELSEAMADYLSRVSESLEQLPYVYQRLFSNDQLADERIFIGREKEIAKLEKAIKYWLNKQISSVMIIGEKGSGTSSLINIAFKNLKITHKIFRNEYSGTIYTEEALLKHLKEVLNLDSVKSTDELIEILNNSGERRIVVIENIEDFFLRIVNGFDALIRLMEIISATNSNVLWITTCNTYSWNYFKKVIGINDYFIFNIKLEDLNYKLVEKVILSRHNISGYDLEFIPSKEIQSQKSYIKLNDKEKQDYLKEIFFENLTKLTSNNIAVALFIWLRSIISANEEKIQVTTDMELDFSFLKSLSDQKLFSLMAILLHDGLSHEEHSKIFNMSLKSSQLLFATLSDDGIIFMRGNNYKVNFQLYKPIINLLKDKNILH